MTKIKHTVEGEVLPRDLGGRPEIEFEPWMGPRMLEMADQGEMVAAVSEELGIGRTTYYKWVKEKPEFKRFHSQYKTRSLMFYERVARDLTLGKIKGGNAAVLALILANKEPEQYSRNGGSGGTQINIIANSVESMTSKERQLEIATFIGNDKPSEEDGG